MAPILFWGAFPHQREVGRHREYATFRMRLVDCLLYYDEYVVPSFSERQEGMTPQASKARKMRAAIYTSVLVVSGLVSPIALGIALLLRWSASHSHDSE